MIATLCVGVGAGFIIGLICGLKIEVKEVKKCLKKT